MVRSEISLAFPCRVHRHTLTLYHRDRLCQLAGLRKHESRCGRGPMTMWVDFAGSQVLEGVKVDSIKPLILFASYFAIHEQLRDARSCSCAVHAPTLPWRRANINFSTNEEYPILQTPRFDSLTLKTALSGSGTECSVVHGLWNGVLQ